jgi:hypothetical protein
MGEKWFQFVKRVKKEQGIDSLKDAMIYAAANKCQWKRDGASTESAGAAKTRRSGSRKARKSRKQNKAKSRKSCCKK